MVSKIAENNKKTLDYINKYLEPVDLLDKEECGCIIKEMEIQRNGRNHTTITCLRCATLKAIVSQCEKSLRIREEKADKLEKLLRNRKKRSYGLSKIAGKKIKDDLDKLPNKPYINPEEELRIETNDINTLEDKE